MIELAPNHKIGLSLSSPVMIASGCGGYGDAYQQLVDLSVFGAVVTNPITLRPRRGPNQPRLAETTGGFIVDVGRQNPGVKKIIQQYQKIWPYLGAPVIAHLPADEPEDLLRTARALSELETSQGQTAIAAIELGVPHHAKPSDVVRWVKAAQEGSALPLLVKLPLDAPLELAETAADVYADAVVIGSPPLGTAQTSTTQAVIPSGIPLGSGSVINGLLYGPALHSLALRSLYTLKSWIDIPLVAAGGIHSLAEAQAFLLAGAAAVQIDSLIFIEPKSARNIALALRGLPGF